MRKKSFVSLLVSIALIFSLLPGLPTGVLKLSAANAAQDAAVN
ncbi:MAG: hypothetical protein K0R67_3966, partial [Paenibacillus sp.]|nr:hypothetical protein [Paenibacillus sp.]